jgi:hypothetical protein
MLVCQLSVKITRLNYWRSRIDNFASPAHNVAMDAPPQLAIAQQTKDADHLKLLAIFHLVFAIICLLGIGFLFLHYELMHHFFGNPDMWKNSKNPPPKPILDFFQYFIWFYVIFGAFLFLAIILNLISALCLHQRKCRTYSLVIAALDCLQIPFGTALGVMTIIVLVRDSVRLSYDKRL